jgi:hypothetical protein
MNLPIARDTPRWLRDAHRTVESAPTSHLLSRVEEASREHTDPRPYSDAAARAMSWVLPPGFSDISVGWTAAGLRGARLRGCYTR